MTVISVALGGAIGASLRYGVGLWSARTFGAGFPVGTMIVNVVGSLVMGIAAVALLNRFPEQGERIAHVLMTGILGGFTTFSAFSLDAITLFEKGRLGMAVLYVGGSVALSLLALFVGLLIGRSIWP